ncbi:MAG: DUF4270 domain-containing protein, partial [Bacteroidota bacterium]
VVGMVLLLITMASCEEELTTLGEGVIGGEPFDTDVAEYEVFAFNQRLTAVQTNRMPVYQVGVYNDPIYGRREAIVTTQLTFPELNGNPTFGNFNQATENIADSDDDDNTVEEDETVKEVILYIPYLQVPNSDTDGDEVPDELDADPNNANSDSDDDGVSDIEETRQGSNPLDSSSIPTADGFVGNSFARTFALDSIFSSTFINSGQQDPFVGKEFTFKVEQSSYFLRDLDPTQGFNDAQAYFSNENIPTFVQGTPLFDEKVTIDNKEFITRQEDNPDTDEIDTLSIATRLPPGIRVALDTTFFQKHLLDMEDSFELLNQSNFSDFIRGLHFSIIPAGDEDLMILFDLTQANITITYEFNDFIPGEDGSAGTVETVERDFTLNLLQRTDQGAVIGNAVNTFIDDPLPSDIASQLGNSGINADRLYLKGGSGSFTRIKLFNQDDGVAASIISNIKANNWVINEANLVFHVDRDALNNVNGTIEPPRLYLYNLETGNALIDLSTEVSNNQSPSSLGQYQNYDGILRQKTNGEGMSYTVRITDYLNDIIVRDSTNASLGLSLTSDVRIPGTLNAKVDAMNTADVPIPVMHTVNPFGTILFGNNLLPEDEDKRLKLQIFYTTAN